MADIIEVPLTSFNASESSKCYPLSLISFNLQLSTANLFAQMINSTVFNCYDRLKPDLDSLIVPVMSI